MSRKETDLQKVITEIKAALQQKELDYLTNDVLPKLNTTSNVGDLLNDNKVQASIQKLLQNPNIAAMLSNPNFTQQIGSLLNSQPKEQLLEQLKNALNTDDEKKKIASAILGQSSYNSRYSNEMILCEALKPFVKSPEQQKTLQIISDFYRYKSILDTAGVQKKAEDDDDLDDLKD